MLFAGMSFQIVIPRPHYSNACAQNPFLKNAFVERMKTAILLGKAKPKVLNSVTLGHVQ
jgi:hypothetical protein